MGRKKKMVYDVPVVDVADRGKSVAKDAEGKVYFIDKAVPGDVVDILVLKKKKSFFQGVVKAYKKKSEDRVEAKCEHFGVCGGCKWQHLDYEAQLRFKSNTVLNAMKRIGKVDPSVIRPIKRAKEIFNYRNKLEYSFSNKRWLTEAEVQSEGKINQSPALGFHAPGAFDKVVDVQTCHLQEDLSNDIRNFVRSYTHEHNLEYYDARAHTGLMRNMILRNTSLGQWMLIMSFAHEDEAVLPMMKRLKEQFPQITSMHYVINKKFNDTILDQDIILYHGEPFIVEQLGDVQYKIGSKSFFQTNTAQANELFETVVEFANFQGNENVYDLYTGLGSIALYVSKAVKHVTGIEEVEPAIIDARENARFNGIENTTFYAGDVKDILTPDFSEKHGKPDLVITDPPRVGMHKDVVQTLLKLEAPRIVYVSCNPATQARDLELLSEKYETKVMQPVDMFPHTHHIENVALLELK
ncbi:MAG: 23S rRNA (uracil(1939)-C(5))-methyltransferase RlmD [Saprospiraceae bacterium]|nr:23S rRNA (uracil(1939)-C(5))-methyltransferase RlmD [Saprospiraceae bacterium]